VLPTSYEYAEVGGADPNASKVPCPMMATYNSASASLLFKQVGAVVRFRVTNCAAGSLTFTFPTAVTGTATVATTPKTPGADGITSLTSAGNSITVTDVPAVASDSYIYITLPVINGTAPQNILVTNTPNNAGTLRTASLPGTSTALSRAGGYKLGVALEEVTISEATFKVSATTSVVLAPGNLMAKISGFSHPVSNVSTATASEWKFGGPFEFIGGSTTEGNYLFYTHNSDCIGKWVDFFAWQGTSCGENKFHGLVTGAESSTYHGDVANESLYAGCWSTQNTNENPATGDYIHITNGGNYDWRPMTKEECRYLLSERATSTLNEVENARFARAVVAGINGLLIFPDNVGSKWNTETMGALPNASTINTTGEIQTTYGDWSNIRSYNDYTASNMVAMLNAGIVFLPAAGVRRDNASGTNSQGISDPTFGRYWNSSGSSTNNYAWGFGFGTNNVLSEYDLVRNFGRSVRLVRVVTP
jgi:hypothetical protein